MNARCRPMGAPTATPRQTKKNTTGKKSGGKGVMVIILLRVGEFIQIVFVFLFVGHINRTVFLVANNAKCGLGGISAAGIIV